MADSPSAPKRRLIVVPIARDDSSRFLLCRMAPDRGVFPGQWALPGGGVEPGERIEQALRREVREELSAEIRSLRPLTFKDAVLPKTLPSGEVRELHMVFLIYECRLASSDLVINEEFSEYRWFSPAELATLDLNPLTRDTLTEIGALP